MQHCSFSGCMEGSQGSRAFDLFTGTLLHRLSCAEIWITLLRFTSLSTLVRTCLHAHRHTDVHMHTMACRYYSLCEFGKTKHRLWACICTHTGMRWDAPSRSQIAPRGAAPGEEGVPLCLRNLPAFRPLSWCTLELCTYPICTPSSSLLRAAAQTSTSAGVFINS